MAGGVGEQWDGWVRQWATDIDAAAGGMVATFESDFGYPAGVNEVRWATADDRADAERYGLDPLTVPPMADFYRIVAAVSLPDVGNGLFIHRASSALALRDEIGYVFVPGADDTHGLPVGSTGGGDQFVVDWGGAVHRSIGASLDGDFVRVADSIEHFLARLRYAVTAFTEDNRIVDV
ncbi:hypothetical protein [Actinoplanes derwentensis]|uniref:SMI1 / KNR4 family (SUKH-1) n=1 Tax=Actinoplanes derwentensis TaxID=113562 RepID=A0A1H1S967_9ACTN|nr:hypothetical protein [Actinoplanes derwentensis]GID83361.1 hypothetical protein Ade03nite_22850 [Actinoplanes derwentensis]SDS44525.1 hypothetical protein SAMN04489716_0801 [Actinoplanes derwentensis]